MAVVAFIMLLKRIGQISVLEARKHLKAGAVVVDVRSHAEYRSRHLPNVLHAPLDTIHSALPRRIKDKNKVLLLHCQSGMRSSVAQRKLKGLGYTNVFNLGSYSRAAQIVGEE